MVRPIVRRQQRYGNLREVGRALLVVLISKGMVEKIIPGMSVQGHKFLLPKRLRSRDSLPSDRVAHAALPNAFLHRSDLHGLPLADEAAETPPRLPKLAARTHSSLPSAAH